MSVSLEQLRQLRSQSGQTVIALPNRPPTGVNQPAAHSIEFLRRLLGVRHRIGPRIAGVIDRILPGEEISPGLRLMTVTVPVVPPSAHCSLAFAKRDQTIDSRRLLFFDTETTGLAGGTGTRAFMIGAAAWVGDVFQVRQLLTTTMAAECAMLELFASWLTPETILSSYNGRCYDSPLLRARYRLARMHDGLHGIDHVDLLFPTRRHYRGVFENCRLATIEREVLGVQRQDDLPGAQAPAAWLTYLRGGSAANLRRVVEHNHQDVVSLALLFLHLLRRV
ncbi:MAG: ribonuclease H-like domain-containing protein [Luteimonas sp.]